MHCTLLCVYVTITTNLAHMFDNCTLDSPAATNSWILQQQCVVLVRVEECERRAKVEDTRFSMLYTQTHIVVEWHKHSRRPLSFAYTHTLFFAFWFYWFFSSVCVYGLHFSSFYSKNCVYFSSHCCNNELMYLVDARKV